MVTEIPVSEEITETQELEAPPVEAEGLEDAAQDSGAASAAPPVDGSAGAQSAEPPKRKPGRPRKNPEAIPKAEAAEAKAKAPKAPRPKLKAPPSTPAQSSPVVPVDPFRATLDTMSSAQLVAELVTRRRQTEREIKQNLYRSFVM
jgi:nucleoid-associated protein YgaU